MIKGAIFDADGTLIDSMGMWDTVGARYLASLGVEARPGLRAILFPMTQVEGAVYMKEAYALAQSHQEIIEGINRTVWDFYRYEVKAKPGALDFLKALRAKGIPCTLATNTDRGPITDGLKTAGLFELLDEIYTCRELNTGKDKPFIYDHARDRMGTTTQETWVFEDAVHGAKTAFQAGYRVAGLADPYSDQAVLKTYCHLYLPDLTDFDGFWAEATK